MIPHQLKRHTAVYLSSSLWTPGEAVLAKGTPKERLLERSKNAFRVDFSVRLLLSGTVNNSGVNMKEGEPADRLSSEDFVEEVETCECLYNKKSNDFKDQCKKHWQ